MSHCYHNHVGNTITMVTYHSVGVSEFGSKWSRLARNGKKKYWRFSDPILVHFGSASRNVLKHILKRFTIFPMSNLTNFSPKRYSRGILCEKGWFPLKPSHISDVNISAVPLINTATSTVTAGGHCTSRDPLTSLPTSWRHWLCEHRSEMVIFHLCHL